MKERQDKLQATYGVRKGGGILIPRSATSPYLLSGILKCGLCGGNLIIITGYDSSGHHLRYGCSQRFNRGACSNSLTVRRDWLEGWMLDELKNYVLQRDAVEYVLDQFGHHVRDAFAGFSNQMAQMRERKQKLEGKLRRLAATAAETGPSAFLVEAINEREKQLRELSDQLLAAGANSVDANLSDIRNFIWERWEISVRSWRATLRPPERNCSSMFRRSAWCPSRSRMARGITWRRGSGTCLGMSKVR
ncbi:MAG TPA: zinc ribbon domain-containing protein [Terracidiphilus sp.]|nr:zinc ribbon domain-containing protein [Terracidiphilus sp.]